MNTNPKSLRPVHAPPQPRHLPAPMCLMQLLHRGGRLSALLRPPSLDRLGFCGLAVLLACSVLVSGCGSSGAGGSGPSPTRSAAGGPVILGEGDAISVVFAGAPEYNTSQKIRSDGKISLAMIGETRAAGLTLPQLQESLSALYKPQLQNPAVTVTLVSSSDAVILSGEVNSPGRRVFDKPTTLLEAILEAGGFSEFADQSKVRIIRVVNGEYQTEVINMKGALKGRPVDVVYVKGGDLIHVPE